MKVSYNWLSQYLDLDLDPNKLAEILTSIGLEVGGVEHIESIKGGLKGVVAGEVLTCGKHPNADRLSVCTVDVGDGEPVQIVCGAPNVAAGQKVWVAKVGAVLYPNGEEKAFTIGKAKMRGETSEGMICAEDELGLGDDHSGIMVLAGDIETGTAAADYYNVTSDTVFDVDLTPNRSDAISHIGVAQDLAAYLTVASGSNVRVKLPQPVLPAIEPSGRPVTVEVRNTEACPRYTGILIENVGVKPSPDWLRNRLTSIGLRPINNVVDITNFVLYEMGQPLHAFDADEIAGDKVIVETLPDGTPFQTLDEVERKLSSNDLMICDGNEHGMCIAGVFGGIGTGVKESTTRIFLESAHFNPTWIRRTSTRYNLRTDAARAYEKTTDPNICVDVLKRAASLICELSGGRIASEITDLYPVPVERPAVTVRWSNISRLIGVELPREKVLAILAALDMGIEAVNDEELTVHVPTNKADVTREADVIEEILRIYGFDNIALPSRLEISLTPEKLPTLYGFRNMLGAYLSSLGFNQMMGLSLTESERYFKGTLGNDLGDAGILIDNTSNVDLNLMRPDLMVSALEAVSYNNSRGQRDLRLFEFGRGYRKGSEGIEETEYIFLTLQGRENRPNWLAGSKPDSDFFTLKKYVDGLLSRVGMVPASQADLTGTRFAFGLKYLAGEVKVVQFGQVGEQLLKDYDIKGPVFMAEFDLKTLYHGFLGREVVVSDISRFPGISRDLAFILPESVTYRDLEQLVRSESDATLKSVELFDIYRNPDQIGSGKKSYAIGLYFEDLTKTLTDKEVERTIAGIVGAVKTKLGGALRD